MIVTTLSLFVYFFIYRCLIFFHVCFQVIKAFGNPEFFNMVFPLLFELCNSEALKSGQAPLVNDAAKAGYDQF